jgi:hypothetical protein
MLILAQSANCYHRMMIGIDEIRRLNLIRLLKAFESVEDFCRRPKCEALNLSSNYIVQLKNGIRKIGNATARKLEIIEGKPEHWMDHEWGIGEPGAEYTTNGGGTDSEREAWNALYDQLSPASRAQMRAIGDTFTQPTEPDTNHNPHNKKG